MRRTYLATLLFLVAMPAAAAGPAPGAEKVVVRGGRDLAEILAMATLDAWKDPANTRPVAIVVDVTPHTMAGEAQIRRALNALGGRVLHLAGRFRIGPLGGPVGAAVRHPWGLAAELSSVLRRPTPERSTIRALARTLAGFDARDGLVVYLADWRFEDDGGLETFIEMIRSRRQSLRVIGSEAAFERPWTTPFWPRVRKQPGQEYQEGIGRCPFGSGDPGAPWHGGDSAFPLIPWAFGVMPWTMEFPLEWGELTVQAGEGGLVEPEDILDRLDQRLDPRPAAFSYPVSSSFGPYGLMRAAAETGGNYYLHSFNPRGRADLVYDYARCNQFPPDLRPRAEILADVRRNPLLSALVEAWTAIGSDRCSLAQLTPPVTREGKPADMDYARGGGLCQVFHTRAERSIFLRRAAADLAVLAEARAALARGLAAPRSPGPVNDRYRADAEFLSHVLGVLAFEISEGMAAAAGIPRNAWDDPDAFPALEPVLWITPRLEPDDDPEEVVAAANVSVFHPEAGRKIVDARREHLRRYAGTPFGEIVFRNGVVTWRATSVAREAGGADPPPTSGTPSETRRNGAATAAADARPPAGSSGGGAATGK